MRWLQSESILKGVFLGLVMFVALQEPSWATTGQVAVYTLGGLALAVAVAAVLKYREGFRAGGRVPAFLLFLLLENPGLIYIGVVGGTLLGALAVRPAEDPDYWLARTVLGGAVLGLIFWQLRHVRQRWYRLGMSLFLAATLVYAGLYLFDRLGELGNFDPVAIARVLLLAIPVFYLLTFVGQEEESEIEIGAMCAALGLAISQLTREQIYLRSAGFLIPMGLFFWYTTRVLPGLRVFKHTLRGLSYLKVSRYRQALLAFRRALQLDPQNKLARDGLWAVHRALDLTQAARDPEMLQLIDLDLCLDRAAALLIQPKPAPEMQDEANRLLDLVADQRPEDEPVAAYWRAVSCLHARDYEHAAQHLERVLDPSGAYGPLASRKSVLLQAWQLALFLHAEMKRRVGDVQLPLPGRRMDAIGAVERQLATTPDDQGAWDLKRVLYSGLTEADYHAACPGNRPVADFDYAYAQQLGLALIEDATRWQRGVEYLHIAARGLPALGPSIFSQIARVQQQAGHGEEALQNFELAKQAGLAIGPKNLSEGERQAYFAAVKLLAETAAARDDLAAAIGDYHLYTEYERSGLETLKVLTELYERKGDPLMALRINEQALVYSSADKELLARKDKYYYSVMPDDLKARMEQIGGGFDADYCLRKSRSLLDNKSADWDVIDWALHLAELLQVARSESLAAKTLRARARLRRGERDEAVALFEDVYTHKPEKFANRDDEEAWFTSCQWLGKLYLDELAQPEKAIACLLEFKKSPKSGADTLYRLGQCYEQTGDKVRAKRYYEQVAAYDGHPLQGAAREALYRLQTGGPAFTE